MKLQLVVNNPTVQNEKNYITCRSNCELFDPITNECGVHDIKEPDNPKIAARCGELILKEHSVESEDNPWEKPLNFDLFDEDFTDEEEADNIFMEFKGEIVPEDSVYPIQPDVPAKREDAIWYVDPDKKFGCWVVNKSPQKFIAIDNFAIVQQGWTDRVYKSPYPLHDHGSSLSLSSRMVWYVDEEGYGQYALLCAGKISIISHPKPSKWKSKQ